MTKWLKWKVSLNTAQATTLSETPRMPSCSTISLPWILTYKLSLSLAEEASVFVCHEVKTTQQELLASQKFSIFLGFTENATKLHNTKPEKNASVGGSFGGAQS